MVGDGRGVRLGLGGAGAGVAGGRRGVGGCPQGVEGFRRGKGLPGLLPPVLSRPALARHPALFHPATLRYPATPLHPAPHLPHARRHHQAHPQGIAQAAKQFIHALVGRGVCDHDALPLPRARAQAAPQIDGVSGAFRVQSGIQRGLREGRGGGRGDGGRATAGAGWSAAAAHPSTATIALPVSHPTHRHSLARRALGLNSAHHRRNRRERDQRQGSTRRAAWSGHRGGGGRGPEAGGLTPATGAGVRQRGECLGVDRRGRAARRPHTERHGLGGGRWPPPSRPCPASQARTPLPSQAPTAPQPPCAAMAAPPPAAQCAACFSTALSFRDGLLVCAACGTQSQVGGGLVMVGGAGRAGAVLAGRPTQCRPPAHPHPRAPALLGLFGGGTRLSDGRG